MKIKLFSYCLLTGLLLGSCNDKVFQPTENGVIVRIQQKNENQPQLVRLQVVGEKLIHVSATPLGKFSKEKSLIAIPPEEQVPFTVLQSGDTISVSTQEVKASVLSSTGEVWFTDKNGKLILQENKGGGKHFTPIEIEGRKGYTIRQVFESPDNEAFYGLGQHQSEEFNYKGKNEELFQYNTKVSVPLLYPIKIMVFCWTVTPYAVSVIQMIIHNWEKCSSCTIKMEKKAP